MAGELIEGYFGQPGMVLLEVGVQAFSTLEKALEYVGESGIDPDTVTLNEVYFTPMGTIYREVLFQEEEE